MKRQLYIPLILLLFISLSCYRDKYEELYPLKGYSNPCDTSLKDTYTTTVSVIMSNKCVSCHSSKSPSGNIDLSNYSNVVGYARSGQLLGSVKHEAGYQAMPPNTQIPSCEIDRIQKWIQLNMPE